jgi:hypothetical protein
VGVSFHVRSCPVRQVKPALLAAPPGGPHVVPAPAVPAFRALEVADVAAELGELALVKAVSGRLDHELRAVELCVAAVVVERGGEHHAESRATCSLRKPIATREVASTLAGAGRERRSPPRSGSPKRGASDLIATGTSLAEVAAICGYYDRAHMDRRPWAWSAQTRKSRFASRLRSSKTQSRSARSLRLTDHGGPNGRPDPQHLPRDAVRRS